MKFFYRTRKGTFEIVRGGGGWAVMFEGDNLGVYSSPQAAAEDLANGYSTWPSFGDPSSLGIPEEVEEWDRSA